MMIFRSAKSLPKICNLRSAGRQNAFLEVSAGAVGGQGGVGKRLWSQQNPISRFNTPSAPQAGAADPNAPSGASTAAPVFVARRLVQLLAFSDQRIFGLAGNLEIMKYRSEFWCLRFCLRSAFACFCSYLLALAVFRQFVSCHWAVCTFCCKSASKIHQKSCKIPQNPSQIDQNGAQERLEKDLGCMSAPSSQKRR